jgi:predicted metallopeptidase
MTNADHDSISCTVIKALTSWLSRSFAQIASWEAKEILVEVFHARPGEVEEMIQRRLEESRPEGREEGRWPATFCLVE